MKTVFAACITYYIYRKNPMEVLRSVSCLFVIMFSLDDFLTEPDPSICNSALLTSLLFLSSSRSPQWEILGSHEDKLGLHFVDKVG